MKKDFTPEDFLKNPNIKESIKYVEFDETPEVIAAKSKQEKDAWRQIYSFAHLVNRSGREYTDTDITKQCELHYIDFDKVERVFKKVFENHKDEFNIDKRPEIYKVELFLNKKWEFIKNEVTQKAEYRIKNSNLPFEKMNTDTIFRNIQHVNFKFPLDKLRSLLRSDFMKTYHPFKDYFEGLDPWDYENDYIGELANYIEAENQEFHVSQFRKMLVRCVGCALYSIENRFVFVLVGEGQETGKSTFIRFLNPFGKSYITEAPIRDNRDTYFAFAENFIYNLEELASLSNVEVNHLKAIISMTIIKERKPHAVDVEEQPRRCNFFASTNKEEFLIDSANSRWIISRIKKINWDYKTKVDINKVWAQAFALFHDEEFNQYLSADESRARDEMNKEFEITDIEKDLIKQCFAVADENTGVFYSNPDIMTALAIKYQGKPLNSRFIGKSMTQLGFIGGQKYLNGHKTRGYYVKPIEQATSTPWENEPIKKATKKEGEQNKLPFDR